MNTQAEAPLTTRDRWLYGGAGALAPLVVALVTLESATVFRDLDRLVLFFWGLKSVLLFLVGGFVAFLHRTETDSWRCFVIGISAPALITTAVAGSNATKKVGEGPTLISSAYAASPLANIRESAGKINVVSTAELQEGFLDKFVRGFFGSNPEMAWIILSREASATDARMVAATAVAMQTCARIPSTSFRGGTREDDPQPLVIHDQSTNAFVPILFLPRGPQSVGFDSRTIRLQPQEVVVSRRSSLSEDFRRALRTGRYSPAWPRIERELGASSDICSR